MKIYELIYDEKQTEVIGEALLDASTITRVADAKTGEVLWIQYKNEPSIRRVLLDSQVRLESKQKACLTLTSPC